MKKLLQEYIEKEGKFFYFRKLILIASDQIILFLSLIFSYLIHGIFIKNISLFIINFLPIFFSSLIIFILTGQYKVLTKYVYSVNIYKIAARNLAIAILTLVFNIIFNLSSINIEIIFSFCFISTD